MNTERKTHSEKARTEQEERKEDVIIKEKRKRFLSTVFLG